MHAWLNNYKVFLTHAKDTRRIYPVQDDAPIQYVKEQDQIFFRLRIKSDLLLRGEDYEWLLAIENGPERCLPITVEVKRIQPGAEDYPTYKGTCYLNKGATIDRDRCEITMKVEAEDNYSRLYQLWEKTVNVLFNATKVCVNTNFRDLIGGFVSFFEVVDLSVAFAYSYTPGDPGPIAPPTGGPAGSGWVLYTDEISGVIQNPTLTGTRSTRWIRERSPANPGGNAPGGWRADGLFYNRILVSFRQYARDYVNTKYFSGFQMDGVTPFTFTVDEYRHYYSVLPFDVPQLCNGVDISECLDKLLDGTGISYRSNFFGINPDGTEPSNDVYNSGLYKRVIVFQRTDILLPGADTPATVFNLTLKDFLDRIQKTYPETVFVMQDNTLVIEHVSYFLDVQGIDITTFQPIALGGKNVYSWDNTIKPAREEWYHESEEQSQYDFRRWTLDYIIDDNCVDDATQTNSIVSDKVCNDVQSMVANPADFTSNQTNLTFVNTWDYDGNLMIDNRDGVLNYRQTPQFLGELLALYRRPFERGAVTTPVVQGFFDPPPPPPILTMLSVLRYRKQVPVSIHLRLLESFDPLKLQKTQMGWGEVIEAEYSLKSGKLTFTPLHL